MNPSRYTAMDAVFDPTYFTQHIDASFARLGL